MTKISLDQIYTIVESFFKHFEGNFLVEYFARSYYGKRGFRRRLSVKDIMALKNEKVDLILSDQRRAFSDEYVNEELCESKTFVQIAKSNPLSKNENLTTEDLKNIPCVLVASENQEENESAFYSDILGFKGGFLFAKNMQEARLLVAAGSGVMPVEGIRSETYFDSAISLVPLFRDGRQISRKYCAFWKADNSGFYIEEFGEILKAQFEE